MRTAITIFLVVATVFAIATLCYVVVDVIMERMRKKNKEDKKEEKKDIPVPIPVPVPHKHEHEVMPEIVEHINAEEADELISDDLALETAEHERGAGHGRQGIINLGVISKEFEPHAVITLDALKEKGLVHKKVHRIKILADGVLDKPITVKAESYSVQAIKMIELTGGTVIILED